MGVWGCVCEWWERCSHRQGAVVTAPGPVSCATFFLSPNHKHNSNRLSTLDSELGSCVGGRGKHNGKPMSILTGSATRAKCDGNEDPAPRACEKATGPIPRSPGPVPSSPCNPSITPRPWGAAEINEIFAEDPIPRYTCFVPGCPGNHSSKWGLCVEGP